MIYSNIEQIRGAYSMMIDIAKIAKGGLYNHHFDNMKRDIRRGLKFADCDESIKNIYNDGEKIVDLIKIPEWLDDGWFNWYKFCGCPYGENIAKVYTNPGTTTFRLFKRGDDLYAYHVYYNWL